MSTPTHPLDLLLDANCSVRGIDAVHAAILSIQPAGSALRIDCSAIEQVDLSFVQLMASAKSTFANRNISLELDRVPANVRTAFDRAGVAIPGSDSNANR